MDELTIEQAHDGFIDSKFTCRELIEYYLDRIRRYNSGIENRVRSLQQQTHSNTSHTETSSESVDNLNLNAILAVSQTALQEAEELDRQYAENFRLLPLHGIPIIVKDCIATAGLFTTYGSIKAKDNVPEEDATVIKKLKAAGAIILAKSALSDWSTGWHCSSSLSGTTRNPHDLRREPGSGTAAAIAADLAILGLDTDTGGAVRLPASFCSLIGLRPRPGMISRHGMLTLIAPQDTPGPVTRTVRDAALMFQEMVGFDPNDALTAYSEQVALVQTHDGEHEPYAATLYDAEPSRLRIGVLESLFGPDEDPLYRAVNDRVKSALGRLEDAGAAVKPFSIYNLQQWIITTSLFADRSGGDLDQFFGKALPSLNLSVKDIFQEKAYHPALDLFEIIANGPDNRLDPAYALRLQRHNDFRPQVMAAMIQGEVDLLAFPTCQVPAPITQDVVDGKWSVANFPTNTYLAAQTALPAISVPVGETEDGLPIGIELVAFGYHERQLFEAATVIEREVRGRIRPRLPQ